MINGEKVSEDIKDKSLKAGDMIIEVESRNNTPIGKYIITSIDKSRNHLDYSLYVLWTNGFWSEKQGSTVKITNLHNLVDKSNSEYTWKKLQ